MHLGLFRLIGGGSLNWNLCGTSLVVRKSNRMWVFISEIVLGCLKLALQ